MEIRFKYINQDSFYGSDYFIKRVGYEEKWDRVKRLGDTYYENELLERSVTEKYGSNLKIGKVENTAGAIGATGSGKLSIDEYIGHNLENKDETKGGSLSLSPNSNVISGVGINYTNKDLESVTKNTIIGNVEIGKSSGDEINRNLDTMTEITEDRDFKTNDEEGLESLGRPANEYVKKKFGEDNNSKIKLTTDGIDLTNADVGEKVGDDIFDDSAHKEALNFTLRDGSKKLTNSSLKVIEEKGIEYALEKGLVKYESTIHKKFSEEKAIKKEIDEKQKIAIQKSKEDPLYNYYLAVDGVSRKVTIEKELKPNSFGKNLKDSTSKALKEGYDSVINSVPNYDKWQEKSKEYGDMESSLAGSVLLQTVGNLITVPGRMATEMNLFGPGEIQYGSVKDIKRRQQELNDVIRGKADLLTTIVAYSAVESIKDSKIFQKFKNKITPSEIPDIKIEDGGSNVVNIQNKDLAKEYQNLINSKKQQDFERIKKGVKEIIKEEASVKAKELKKDLAIDNVNEIKVVDNSADITKASKNIEKVSDVSENITKVATKEVKVIDKSNDTGKIAKNTNLSNQREQVSQSNRNNANKPKTGESNPDNQQGAPIFKSNKEFIYGDYKKSYIIIRPMEGKIQSIEELLTLEGQAKLPNMTMQEIYDLAKKEGLNIGDLEGAGISGIGQKFNIVGNGKEKIEIKVNGKKIKERNVLSIRSNSGGIHNSSYILIGTDDGKIKVIFGSPEKYEYNPTNIEKAELIFVEQPKSK